MDPEPWVGLALCNYRELYVIFIDLPPRTRGGYEKVGLEIWDIDRDMGWGCIVFG